MTLSLPSREIYVTDVPGVRSFFASFVYNFFTTDERTNDEGLIPEKEFKLNSDQESTSFAVISARIPRFVKFNFTPTKLIEFNRFHDEFNIEKQEPLQPGLISKNLDKIVSEDEFSSNAFVSVGFNDGDIENKVHDVISGSITEFLLRNDVSDDMSQNKLAKMFASSVGDDIDFDFISRYFGKLDGKLVKFFSSKEGRDRVRNMSTNSSIGVKSTLNDGEQPMFVDAFYQRVHNVNTHVQINSKVFHDLIKRQVDDPYSQFAGDVTSLYDTSKTAQDASKNDPFLKESDYRPLVPFIDVKMSNSSFITDTASARVVGYIIDKTSVSDDGTIIDHEPIIVENPNATYSIDTRIRYGVVYRYQIRTIVQFTLPAIESTTGDIATIKTLISSRPTRPVYVTCDEQVAPPAPVDLAFTWNHETETMMVSWNYPVNRQRDIKYFQIFRRASLEEPFELVKMYDFDDSEIKIALDERANAEVVETLSSPATFWTDDDFKKTSKYIYAIVSIDAHGFSSGYSTQFQVSFDVFKNRLQKTFVSHSGAPKPYPNMYIEKKLFVDAVRTTGSKRMKLYFNPEYYQVVNNEGKTQKIVATKQDGAKYKLNVLNLDNQKSETIEITINDHTKLFDEDIKANRILNRTKL